jgi:hypothetical protein
LDFLPDPDKIYGPEGGSENANKSSRVGRRKSSDDDDDDGDDDDDDDDDDVDDGDDNDDDDDDDDGDDESACSELDMRRFAGGNEDGDDDGFNSCDYDDYSSDEDAQQKPLSGFVLTRVSFRPNISGVLASITGL